MTSSQWLLIKYTRKSLGCVKPSGSKTGLFLENLGCPKSQSFCHSQYSKSMKKRSFQICTFTQMLQIWKIDGNPTSIHLIVKNWIFLTNKYACHDMWIRSSLIYHTWTRPVWNHDDGIKRKHLPRYWPFVKEMHRSPVDSPHKDQFSLICAWTNNNANNRDTGDLRRYCAHYDVTVMFHWIINTREIAPVLI